MRAMKFVYEGLFTMFLMINILPQISTSIQIQEELYKEICENFPNRDDPIVPNRFEHMPFLKAVYKENFRKYPIAPANLRLTQSDMVLQGYKIPKGTTVFMEWGTLSNQNETFPDPEVSLNIECLSEFSLRIQLKKQSNFPSGIF